MLKLLILTDKERIELPQGCSINCPAGFTLGLIVKEEDWFSFRDCGSEITGEVVYVDYAARSVVFAGKEVQDVSFTNDAGTECTLVARVNGNGSFLWIDSMLIHLPR